MPPKAKPASSAPTDPATVYVVTNNGVIDTVFASSDPAHVRADALKSPNVKVEKHELKGGSIQVFPVEAKQPAAAKSKPKPKAVKNEDLDDEDEAEAEAPKASTSTKKTKPAAEQRAENAKKPGKTADTDIPDDVKALLATSGDVFSGMTVVVTGVPPILGRKNAEKLVESHGAKLGKSISKNTRYVVVGNDAGPKKLEQIADLGIETLDENALMHMVRSGGGSKRAAEDDDEKPAKAKKQKK